VGPTLIFLSCVALALTSALGWLGGYDAGRAAPPNPEPRTNADRV
jgi:hypothetical protein